MRPRRPADPYIIHKSRPNAVVAFKRAKSHMPCIMRYFEVCSSVSPNVPLLAVKILSSRQASLCHGCVLLLEPVAQPLGALHVLIDASHDTAFFARGEGFALEAVDAAVEALLDEVGVHLLAMH